MTATPTADDPIARLVAQSAEARRRLESRYADAPEDVRRAHLAEFDRAAGVALAAAASGPGAAATAPDAAATTPRPEVMPVDDPVRQPPVGHYVAIGLAQGLLIEPDDRNAVGLIRAGGTVVEVAPFDYHCWLSLQQPTAEADAGRLASAEPADRVRAALDRLTAEGLLARVDAERGADPPLGLLRPIPLGVGLGNGGTGDPTRFEIQNLGLSLPRPLAVDPVGALLWWEFDGAGSIAHAVRRVQDRTPEIAVDVLGVIAARFVLSLMSCRLLSLDRPVEVGGSAR